MTWLSWTLLYVVAIVSYYFFSKRMFNEDQDVDPRFYGGLLQVAVGIMALIPALIEGWYFVWNTTTIIWLVVVAVAYTIGPSLYYIGLKHTHLSVTTTLDAMGAVYALFLGTLILQEPWEWSKLAGVAMVLLGVAVVSGKNQALFKLNKYEMLLVIAPIFYVLGGVADNTLVKYSNATTYLALSFLVAGMTMTAVNLPRLKKIETKSLGSPLFIKTLLISSLFIGMAGYASYKAYLLGGEVSVMYPIMQTESVVTPFMAMWLLGERERFGHKILGALLAFGGVWFLG